MRPRLDVFSRLVKACGVRLCVGCCPSSLIAAALQCYGCQECACAGNHQGCCSDCECVIAGFSQNAYRFGLVSFIFRLV